MRPEPKKPPGLLPLLMLAGLGTALGCAAAAVVPRTCAGGLQGSFLQLTDRQVGFGARDWLEPFALLRATGADTVILQFTGDRAGAYDDRVHASIGGPVRAILSAAAASGLRVYLGLHADPTLAQRRGGRALAAAARGRGARAFPGRAVPELGGLRGLVPVG